MQKSKDNTINDIVLVLTSMITVVAGAYIYVKMRRAKKILLEEQAKRLDAKRTLSRDFSPDTNIEVTEGFNHQERTSRTTHSVRPPTPSWQEGAYEMDDVGKQRMRMQEFI